MSAITIFIFIGALALAWQTYTDLKKGEVDSRRNWLMYGVVLSIVLYENLNILIYLAAVFGTMLFTGRISRMFADGDLEALRWTIPGWIMLSWAFGLVYLFSFCFLTVFYIATRHILKIRGKTAGYTIITGAFAITAALAFGL